MLDTADKHTLGLSRLWSEDRIASFVSEAHRHGLLCGLAGRLSLTDIPQLLPLQADYLGFRTALCDGNRRAAIDAKNTALVRAAMQSNYKSAVIQHRRLAFS
jgi:dihydroneopterin aldolase